MAKKKKKRVKAKRSESESGPALASFESALHELEKTVRELEAGNLSLSDSLTKYENGIRNLKTCHQILEHAEARIRLLTGIEKNGSASTTDFDSQESELYQTSVGMEADDSLDDSLDTDETADEDSEEHEYGSESIEEEPDEEDDDSGTLF